MSGDCEMEEVPTAVLCRRALPSWRGTDLRRRHRYGLVVRHRRTPAVRGAARQRADHHPSLGRMGSALGADRRASPTHRRRRRPLYPLDTADGRMTLYPSARGRQCRNRSNDARVHPSGTFWIGTMGRKAEAGAGRDLRAASRRDLAALPGDHHPERDLLLAGRAIGYFADTGEE